MSFLIEYEHIDWLGELKLYFCSYIGTRIYFLINLTISQRFTSSATAIRSSSYIVGDTFLFSILHMAAILIPDSSSSCLIVIFLCVRTSFSIIFIICTPPLIWCVDYREIIYIKTAPSGGNQKEL